MRTMLRVVKWKAAGEGKRCYITLRNGRRNTFPTKSKSARAKAIKARCKITFVHPCPPTHPPPRAQWLPRNCDELIPDFTGQCEGRRRYTRGYLTLPYVPKTRAQSGSHSIRLSWDPHKKKLSVLGYDSGIRFTPGMKNVRSNQFIKVLDLDSPFLLQNAQQSASTKSEKPNTHARTPDAPGFGVVKAMVVPMIGSVLPSYTSSPTFSCGVFVPIPCQIPSRDIECVNRTNEPSGTRSAITKGGKRELERQSRPRTATRPTFIVPLIQLGVK